MIGRAAGTAVRGAVIVKLLKTFTDQNLLFVSNIFLFMRVTGPPEPYYCLIIAEAGELSQEDSVLR